jgi:polysaccharide export outer membrane protein
MKTKRTQLSAILLSLACGVLLASCASVPFRPISATEKPQPKVQKASEYVLGPDDVLRLVVEQHPEWSGEFTIRPDGNIFLPSIGEFKMDGFTKDTAAVALGSYLEKYINNPRVTFEVVRYASQYIYVLGEVNHPGRYVTGGKNVTVRDGVILADLPTRFAALSRVYVINPVSSGKPNQQVIDLDRILNRGEMARNYSLEPGSIVYVPKNIWGYISEFFGVFLSPVSSTVTSVPAARAALVP